MLAKIYSFPYCMIWWQLNRLKYTACFWAIIRMPLIHRYIRPVMRGFIVARACLQMYTVFRRASLRKEEFAENCISLACSCIILRIARIWQCVYVCLINTSIFFPKPKDVYGKSRVLGIATFDFKYHRSLNRFRYSEESPSKGGKLEKNFRHSTMMGPNFG